MTLPASAFAAPYLWWGQGAPQIPVPLTLTAPLAGATVVTTLNVEPILVALPAGSLVQVIDGSDQFHVWDFKLTADAQAGAAELAVESNMDTDVLAWDLGTDSVVIAGAPVQPLQD